MPNIQVLPTLVADMIAAGEVVERPGSVVKELMENAIDAGAKNITIELRAGGTPYIRVTDDGCGMSPEDAGVAFLRHATSKLTSARGLEAIGTLGFRGEALAAISAVSRVELMTRQRGAETGTLVVLEAGEIQEMRPTGCPEGTTMIVRDLFFNTPARFKFLKSDRAEAQNCVAAALRCALGHPQVSVKCIRDGRDVFFSPGDGRLDSCVYSLLGRDVAQGFLAAESEWGGVTVRGFVSSPRAGRGNRSGQFFFCNERSIHSTMLQSALEQAYRNSIMVGRFPACVLYITLPCGAVDVNVHPTKNEVKFSDEKSVFDAVYHAALGALEQENALPARAQEASAPRFVQQRLPETKPEPERFAPQQLRIPTGGGSASTATPKPREDFYRRMNTEDYRREIKSGTLRPEMPARPVQGEANYSALRSAQGEVNYSTLRSKQGEFNYSALPIRSPSIPYEVREQNGIVVRHVEIKHASDTEETPFRVIGEVFGCYILVQQGEELVLIDKHAAHERILFDQLKAQKRSVMSQTLLVPVTLTPGEADAQLLLENAPTLEKLGFEIEPFGADSVVLRAVPADTDEAEAKPMLEEILETLRAGLKPDGESALDEILHTIACKAAIKAGRSSALQELDALARRVLTGEVRYCPHGRPVSIVLSKKELDKRFGRLG
ncbi:MAG: DNA mismatch repair endonuclease MutL [Oscillospiraceae bacterium]|nr:DNA mismatch repair endonuclease MutL [Oscillospiraceae bacterium]